MQTVAATSDLTKRINAIEHELDEGPCRQALLDHGSYRIDDMSTDSRWPRFAAAADARGVRSMLGYALFTSDRTLGTLDLYSSKRNAFDVNSEVIGELFAAHAAIALTGSARQAEFHRALSSRDTIGIAKGILMHREGITADQAFHLLVAASQNANMKLHDVAVWLVERHAPRRLGVLTDSAQLVNSRFAAHSRRGQGSPLLPSFAARSRG